ncbi:MAG: flavodoxin domain-containing protein, partial [Fibrobacter sp.]|nr:flavodoxin domain-containing protein [Fibrobacter sp.]
MNITKDIRYVGVNDHEVDLFEGQYKVPNGMSYNSYIIMDEKIAVMDTVDIRFSHEWLDNLGSTLDGKKPDYLVVQHMEPDHSANIANFLNVYPDTAVVANSKTFAMIDNFFGKDLIKNKVSVANGETLDLGKHKLTFVFAPMVHWPEVMVTYDSLDKVLFSADGFGKFGAIGTDEPWDDEARRYYIGIVGKYGAQVQALLKAASTLDIKTICPLHGPVLSDNLGHYIDMYNTWSSYVPESEGILIAYTSVYGNTKKAVELLANKIRASGCPKLVVHDLARTDMALAVADAFRYGKVVLATTTYNADVFPFMKEFINHLTERNFRNRTVAIIENGSWAPQAARVIKRMFENSKNISFLENVVSIRSAMNKDTMDALSGLASELCREYVALGTDSANKNDMTALFRIGYGLYVVTSNDGKKDNGLIVNTVTQVSDNPNYIAVNIN